MLWLEDNEFESFPVALCQLKQLVTLRLSGNSLNFIPMSISSLLMLETLVSQIYGDNRYDVYCIIL